MVNEQELADWRQAFEEHNASLDRERDRAFWLWLIEASKTVYNCQCRSCRILGQKRLYIGYSPRNDQFESYSPACRVKRLDLDPSLDANYFSRVGYERDDGSIEWCQCDHCLFIASLYGPSQVPFRALWKGYMVSDPSSILNLVWETPFYGILSADYGLCDHTFIHLQDDPPMSGPVLFHYLMERIELAKSGPLLDKSAVENWVQDWDLSSEEQLRLLKELVTNLVFKDHSPKGDYDAKDLYQYSHALDDYDLYPLDESLGYEEDLREVTPIYIEVPKAFELYRLDQEVHTLINTIRKTCENESIPELIIPEDADDQSQYIVVDAGLD